MKQTIAVLNQKGGVGKTTTVVNLAAYLTKLGRSVLIVDLDPQGNATSGLGISKQQLEATLYDMLFNSIDVSNVVLQTNIHNVYILPTNANLAAAEIDLAGEKHRELKLKNALTNITYDYVLIDCPPALGLLSINALVAADKVLIPVQAEYYALEGLSQLLNTIQRVREGINPELELLGVLVTMFDSRTTLSEQVMSEVQKHFGDKVFKNTIPRNVRLAEAPSYGKSIAQHDKWSKGARAYKQLAKEIDKEINKK